MDLTYILEAANWSDGSQTKVYENYLHTKPYMAIPYLVIICLAIVCGTVGNVMVIGAVLVNKHLKTTGNMFIVNLAVADLCVTAFVDPFSVVGIVIGEGWFAEHHYICEAVASICLTSCFCSLLSIGAVSFNRYIHICHNQLYSKIFTRRNSFLMCIGLWVVCFLAEMSCFIGWGDHSYDKKTLSCVWDRTADFSYTVFFSTAGVAFPVVLISICYIKIYRFVKASRNRVAAMQMSTPGGIRKPIIDQDGKVKESAENESMKLARTLFIIFAVFSACWTPYAIIVVADMYDVYPMEVHIFAILVAHTNSSLNSVLYGLTNNHFRRGYLKLLKMIPCAKWWRLNHPHGFRRSHLSEETLTSTQNIRDMDDLQGTGSYRVSTVAEEPRTAVMSMRHKLQARDPLV